MTLLVHIDPLEAADAKVVRLANGLTTLIQEDERFPLVSMRLYVAAGSSYENEKEAGVSHLLEHMVFKGSEKRPGGRIAQEIESAGGYLNAATSFDYTVYLTDMPAERWVLGLEAIADMTSGPLLDPAELEREKKVVLSELERGEDEPGSRLFKTLQPMLWPGASYAWPIIGFRETVAALSALDIRNYVRRFYQPQSMVLVVCGKVKADEALTHVERIFGGMKNDRVTMPAKPLAAQPGALTLPPGPRVRVERGAWNKAYLSVAMPIAGFRSAETPTVEVLAQLLGGDQTSRLYRAFKYDRQLVDSISASAMTLERGGMFYIRAVLDPAKLDLFWRECISYLSKLDARDFTDAELQRAKLNLEDSLYQSKETLAGLASKLGFFQFFEHGLEAEGNYLLSLRSVNREQLGTVLKERFNPQRLAAVALLPAGADNATTPAAQLETAMAKTVSELWPGSADRAATKAAAGKTEAETIDLGPGARLILLPDTSLPYASLNCIFRGGDSLLSAAEQGLAELSSEVMTRGTRRKSAQQIQEFLSDRAADLNVHANRDLFSLDAKFPTRFSADMLSLIREILEEPSFPAEEIEREKKNLIANIKRSEDQPLGLAFRNIFPFLFHNHHYGYFHQGDPERIKTYTAEAISGFWKKQRQEPWTMAVCGDFDREAVLALGKDLLKTRPSRPGNNAFTEPRWGEDRAKDLHLSERNQAHLIRIFRAPGQNHPDTPGFMLLRAILGGQSGLLFQDLREEQGLGYSVTAMLWQSPVSGFLALYIGTDPQKTEQSLQGFHTVVDNLIAKPLSEADLSRGKNLLRVEYYRDHQSLLSRSGEAATLLAQGLPLSLNRSLIDKAQSLTAADIQTLAKQYLVWDQAYMMRVLP